MKEIRDYKGSRTWAGRTSLQEGTRLDGLAFGSLPLFGRKAFHRYKNRVQVVTLSIAGVYIMVSEYNEVLYIGESTCVLHRLCDHMKSTAGKQPMGTNSGRFAWQEAESLIVIPYKEHRALEEEFKSVWTAKYSR